MTPELRALAELERVAGQMANAVCTVQNVLGGTSAIGDAALYRLYVLEGQLDDAADELRQCLDATAGREDKPQ